MFDLLIRRAKIVDGTGQDAYIADLGVVGERITSIGTLDSGQPAGRIIDGRGLVLAPGFVDIHGHSDYTLLIDPRAESKIRQGITTEVVGNCGYSAFPMFGHLFNERKLEYESSFGFSLDWQTLPEYLKAVENASPSLNYVFLVGFNTLRASAMGFESNSPSSSQMTCMERWVEESLDYGVFGLSVGLAYAPACFARKEELVRLARLVGRRGGFLASHIRDEGNNLFAALEEVLTIAREADLPLQISHLKTAGRSNWWKLDRALQMIESAGDDGLEVTFDRYPYLALQTSLQSFLPKWAQEGGPERISQRIQTPAIRQDIINEMIAEEDQADFWGRVYLSLTGCESCQDLEGQSFNQIAAVRGEPPVETALDLLQKTRSQAEVTLLAMSERNLTCLFQHPSGMIASDSSSRSVDGPLRTGKPHPRAFGTFPRVLEEFCRQKRELSLEEAIRKMTCLPCQKLGLADRGAVKEGMFADLMLFDPEQITDQATYQDPFQYPSGIRLVVVNGQICLEEGISRRSGQGRILYRP